IVPFADGGSTGVVYGEAPRPVWLLIESCGYPGILVSLAFIAGVPSLLREPRGRFWLGVAIVAGVLGTGVLGGVVPGPGARAPTRLLLWWTLAAASAAALVLSRLQVDPASADAQAAGSMRPPGARAWAAAVVAAVVLVAWSLLSGPFGRRA